MCICMLESQLTKYVNIVLPTTSDLLLFVLESQQNE